MGTLRLTLACGDYDRTAALRRGDVRVEGVELNYLALPVEETFFRMVKYREFDVAEMSLSTYVMTLGDRPEASSMVAIPVFPSRAFRHSGIYVTERGGIHRPSDLIGRVVGVPEYQMTAAVWIRGILAEHHGVPVESVTYRTGGLHDPGRAEKFPFVSPPGVNIEPIPLETTLSELLLSGGIDALYTARTPRPFRDRTKGVRRLFQSAADAESEYFNATGVFPIMHTIVLKRELYESNPWLARSLMKAFETARVDAFSGIDETAALRSMVPWMHEEIRRTQAIMGDDYWPYGLEENRDTLSVFLKYSYDQGLAKQVWEPADLFAPETIEDGFAV